MHQSVGSDKDQIKLTGETASFAGEEDRRKGLVGGGVGGGGRTRLNGLGRKRDADASGWLAVCGVEEPPASAARGAS